MATTEQWTRVILLAPPALAARATDSTLQAQFAARDWFPIYIHDPYVALAELCIREKSQVSRAAWGLQRLEHISFVVQEPQEWREAGVNVIELAEAVQRYVPAASVWHIEGDEIILTHRAAERNADEKRQTTGAAGMNGSHYAHHIAANRHDVTGEHDHPELRIASDTPIHAVPGTLDDEAHSLTRLTRQEIEMLLDPLGSAEGGVAS